MHFVPTKLYYKIREACEIVGVEAHVLRFWETEFPALSPPKSKSGQRTYRPKDIELLLQIRKLLYEDGFTIAGARKRLSVRHPSSDDSVADANVHSVAAAPAERVSKPVAHRKAHAGPKTVANSKSDGKPASEKLRKVQAELENILTLLDRE
jgi:DNA-binding transcriptional MerR regulator